MQTETVLYAQARRTHDLMQEQDVVLNLEETRLAVLNIYAAWLRHVSRNQTEMRRGLQTSVCRKHEAYWSVDVQTGLTLSGWSASNLSLSADYPHVENQDNHSIGYVLLVYMLANHIGMPELTPEMLVWLLQFTAQCFGKETERTVLDVSNCRYDKYCQEVAQTWADEYDVVPQTCTNIAEYENSGFGCMDNNGFWLFPLTFKKG